MTRNNQAEDKLDDFINKLESRGYEIKPVRKKPQIYSIDGELVNIRSRRAPRETEYGRVFWYDVAFSVLQDVKWVIYITTSSDYFVMFPSSFLEGLKDLMYPVERDAGKGVFNIDWDNEMIELKGETKSIGCYYHNLIEQKDFPTF